MRTSARACGGVRAATYRQKLQSAGRGARTEGSQSTEASVLSTPTAAWTVLGQTHPQGPGCPGATETPAHMLEKYFLRYSTVRDLKA